MKLFRGEGPPISVGHRGAALLAPENTLGSFEVAIAAGAEAIEFDVLDLLDGPLVLAHCDDLLEVSHGAASGTVRIRTLAELREIAPDLPTLDEALAFIAARPGLIAHVDLKLTTRLGEVAAAIVSHGLEGRTIASSFHVEALAELRRHAPGVKIGFTYPEDRLGVTRHRVLHPLIRFGTRVMRIFLPWRIAAMADRAGAQALMLHHAVVSAAAVERAHAVGIAVWAWTVDEPADLQRMRRAGVDAVITNDPTILAKPLLVTGSS